MLITLSSAAHGGPPAASVLGLEPLLVFLRQCRPDAVSLLPPPGPDDLPNGAALLAIKNRLEQEGLRAVGGCWRVPHEAPVEDPGWQVQSLFGARALVAALGEAGVEPLGVEWDASTHTRSGERAVTDYLERLLEEAERARVRLALRSPLAGEALVELTGRLASPWLGLYTDLDRWQDAPAAGTARALQMVRAVMPDEENGRCQAAALTALRESGFDGPLLISLEGGPVEHARAVGFYRGVLAAV